MAPTLNITLPGILTPGRITGPLFGKELRVSSRRRRNYLLRFVYLVLLTGFVAIVWADAAGFSGSFAVQKSQMAMAGKRIISTVVFFQFFMTQLAAIVMLSTSISDEIYHQTLGLLMTTTITGRQIVYGKVLSKLLQLVLLLALGLPLLAVVRIFGGVPAPYILSSFCITLSAVVFAGSLSMFFSINERRAYVVIIKTLFAMGFLFFFLPMLAGSVYLPGLLFRGPGRAFLNPSNPGPVMLLGIAMLHANPFAMLFVITQNMLSPGALRFFYWPAHCGVMLAMSFAVLQICIWRVRKVALRQAVGQLQLVRKRVWWKKKNNKAKSPTTADEPEIIAGPIKRVKGSPVLWRELRAPAIQGIDNKNSLIGLAISVGAIILTYIISSRQNSLQYEVTHVAYMLLFVILGGIVTLVRAATSITIEKESRTWPLLLATSLSEWRILSDKAIATFRRSAPIWLFALGHLVLFFSLGYVHIAALLHVSILILWLIVFFTGSGLYFSSLFRHSTSAVVATIAMLIVLWGVLPTVFILSGDVYERDAGHPIVQTVVIIHGSAGLQNASLGLADLKYQWPHGRTGFAETTGLIAVSSIAYMLVGIVLMWRAGCRFRKKIF